MVLIWLYFNIFYRKSKYKNKSSDKAEPINSGAKEASFLEHLYNIAQWIFEHGKSELFAFPELVPLPPEKLLPEKQYAF